MRTQSIILLFFLSSFYMVSCELNDPVIINEEELITTVIFTMTPEDNSEDIVFRFEDLDGTGGNDPVIMTGVLKSNSVYTGNLRLLNTIENPQIDISEEVFEEGVDHQVFYEFSDTSFQLSYNDLDIEGNPIGLNTKITSSNPGSSTLKIILRHEPNKTAPGVADGTITNAGGETDIEIIFPIDVQ